MTLPRTLVALLATALAPSASLAQPVTPTVLYSRLIPADAHSGATAIATDAEGNAYLTGFTCSATYPQLSNDPTAVLDPFGGGCDAFVTKVGPGGALVYSTFLGGTAGDEGRAIAVDSAGNAYVAGYTLSPSIAGEAGHGSQDAFVAKLNPGGTRAWVKVLGGARSEEATGLAVDPLGNVVVVGRTTSADFPVTGDALLGGYPPNTAGGLYFGTAFLARYDAAGAPAYATYFAGAPRAGGLAYRVNAVAVDATGSPYLAGFATVAADTTSARFAGGAAPTHPAAFVIKLGPAATSVVYETYFGGDGFRNLSNRLVDSVGNDYIDEAFAIAVDGAGEAFVTGVAGSPDFPTILCSSGPGCGPPGGSSDAFVMHLSGNGVPGPSRLLGGRDDDLGTAIAVAPTGAAVVGGVYVLGTTRSDDLPVSDGSTYARWDWWDTFLVAMSPALDASAFSAYVGGLGDDLGAGIGVGPSGDLSFAGATDSGSFSPTFPVSNPGPVDAMVPFVARVRLDSGAVLSLVLSPEPGFLSTTGVLPAAAPPAGPFTLKVVALDTGNRPPVSVQACIDATCWNMALDPAASHDGSFVNGEQYAVTVALPVGTAEGAHQHYFRASDGVTTVTTGQLSGPVVDATPPALTVANPTWRTRVVSDADRLPLDPVSFGVGATDALSPPVSIRADRVDGLAVPAGYAGLPRGPHSIAWRAVDAAGNAATLTQQVIVDTPSAVYSSPVPGSSTLVDVSSTGHLLGDVSVTASPPAGQGLSFGSGTISFVVSCPPPGTVSVVLRFTPALPPRIQPAKVSGGTTTAIPAGSWSRIDAGGATLVTLLLVDGGPLDQDGGVVGSVSDPVAIGVPDAPAGPASHQGCSQGGGGLPSILVLLALLGGLGRCRDMDGNAVARSLRRDGPLPDTDSWR